MGFNIANFLWFMSGSKDVEPINFYNKKGMVFSNTGKYYESAFGDRIFGTYRLLEYAKDLLISDVTTRRALAPLFFPNDLVNLPNDTPCASSLQLMVRDGKLDFFLHMRSQSVIMVFPYDLFLFSMLHEYLSVVLDKDLGTLHYYANSFHYYMEEQDILDDILKEAPSMSQPMENMPRTTPQEVETIILFEKAWRQAVLDGGHRSCLAPTNLSDYWQNLLSLLCAKGLAENSIEIVEQEPRILNLDGLFV